MKSTVQNNSAAKLASFHPKNTNITVSARKTDLYYYTAYIGKHEIIVDEGDCIFYLTEDRQFACVSRGPCEIHSNYIATVIRGYMPDDQRSSLLPSTHLPYINACSTKQIFPPIRLGDPTLQMLILPPHTTEQAHHIHSTTRVVYVLSGDGQCIVGMSKHFTEHELTPGMVVILDKMCPHHFVTHESELIVLPLHVYSSAGNNEFNHPMYNGTHRV